MKRAIAMICVAAAAMMMSAGTAQAQFGYGGGFGGYGYGNGFHRGGGISIGYSRFSPRSSFSIGYNDFRGRSYGGFHAPVYRNYRAPVRYRSNFGRSFSRCR